MNENGKRQPIGYFGHPGSFTEEAALHLLGSHAELAAQPSVEALFAGIADGAYSNILIPIENTLAGTVDRCVELLLESQLVIKAEVIIQVSLHLVGSPGSSFNEIRTVESHPTALAECGNFFRRYPHIVAIAAGDTAGSVARVVEAADRARAAIAGERAARIYGGSILQFYLEDSHANQTRFVLVGKNVKTPSGGNKTLIKPPSSEGLLNSILGVFVRRNIPLMKIFLNRFPSKSDLGNTGLD